METSGWRDRKLNEIRLSSTAAKGGNNCFTTSFDIVHNYPPRKFNQLNQWNT